VKYLVMMPHSWGKGDTIEEADKKARQEGGHGRKKTQRVVFEFDPDKTQAAYIDDFGMLCWKGERPKKLDEAEKSENGSEQRQT